MDSVLKTKWLEALRSGKFEQGHKQLAYSKNKVNHYCCLGVLCEVAGLEKKPFKSKFDRKSTVIVDQDFVSPSGETMFATLSQDVTAQFGLTEEILEECVQWNDGEGLSFSEIADNLEKIL